MINKIICKMIEVPCCWYLSCGYRYTHIRMSLNNIKDIWCTDGISF